MVSKKARPKTMERKKRRERAVAYQLRGPQSTRPESKGNLVQISSMEFSADFINGI
jgi:hypothetical protein